MGGMSQLETYTQRIRREGYEEGYKEAYEEAYKEAYEEGLEIDRREVDAEFVVRMVRGTDFPLDEIADLLGISMDDARSYALDAGLSVD